MIDFKEIYKEIEEQIASLAGSTVSNYKDEAIKDGKLLLEDMKADLMRWTSLLTDKQIKVNEFEWLVNSDKELVKMKGLEKAGLAAARISAFGHSVLSLIVDVTLSKVIGNN